MRRFVISVVVIALGAGFFGCRRQHTADPFHQLPRLVSEFTPTSDGQPLQPVRLQLFEDTLYVSYNGVPRIDKYTSTFDRVDSILLNDPEPVNPTSFVVIDSQLIVANHARHLVVIYDRTGGFQQSFGTTPDGNLLSPFALDALGGVAYVGDLNLRKVLAVSLVDAEGITERGELILTIPSDSGITIGFPSAVHVTPDGRLLLGDAGSARIMVFTCDGRYVYDFAPVTLVTPMAPQAITFDNVSDPRLDDSTVFDPSGVNRQGRYHVADANNACIHMFNPLGEYIGSYPPDSLLVRPSGLAIDRLNRRIYVADSGAGKIFVFEYER